MQTPGSRFCNQVDPTFATGWFPFRAIIHSKLNLDKNTVNKSINNLIKFKLLTPFANQHGVRNDLAINPLVDWQLIYSVGEVENTFENDLISHPVPTENLSNNKYIKIEELIKDKYPRREGLSKGVSTLKAKCMSDYDLELFQKTLTQYIQKYDDEDKKYCLGLERFVEDWRDYEVKESKIKKINWEGK